MQYSWQNVLQRATSPATDHVHVAIGVMVATRWKCTQCSGTIDSVLIQRCPYVSEIVVYTSLFTEGILTMAVSLFEVVI